MPELSIITVCLNEQNSIRMTLDSIINQNFMGYELIVIDGGSNDGTIDIIRNYEKFITTFVSEKDKGIFDAQNKGAGLATGEYLLFLNAGDYLCDNYSVGRFHSHSQKTDIISGDIIFEENGRLLYRRPAPPVARRSFMMLESLPHPASFISRSLFEKAGGYKLEAGTLADYDFFMKALFGMNATYSRLPFRTSIFNLSGVSTKKDKSPEVAAARRKIQNEYLPEMYLKIFRAVGLPADFLLKKIPHLTYKLKGI